MPDISTSVMVQQSQYRELLPAPPRESLRSESNSPPAATFQPQDKRKGRLVKIACQVCARRRVKCDGQRPQCSSCRKRGDTCIYDFDVSIGTTRYQALQRRHAEVEQNFNRIMKVLELLRQRPRDEAIVIFEEIRRGGSLDDLLKAVSDGDMLMGFASPGDGQQPVSRRSGPFDASQKIQLPRLGSIDISVHLRKSSSHLVNGRTDVVDPKSMTASAVG